MRRLGAIVLFFGALLGAWQLAAMSGRWSPVLFPSPLAVVEYIWGAMRDGSLRDSSLVTLRRLIVGYIIGIALGLPLGVLMSTSRLAEDTIGALALGLQTLPSVCWVPLALIWFGQTETAMLFVVNEGNRFFNR